MLMSAMRMNVSTPKMIYSAMKELKLIKDVFLSQYGGAENAP
jgi:hypothetical protein